MVLARSTHPAPDPGRLTLTGRRKSIRDIWANPRFASFPSSCRVPACRYRVVSGEGYNSAASAVASATLGDDRLEILKGDLK